MKSASETLLRLRVDKELQKHWMVDVLRIASELASFIPEATEEEIATELASMVTASKGRPIRHHQRSDDEQYTVAAPGSGEERGRVLLFPSKTPFQTR
jgi:Uri superfamily endonuclease